MTNVCNTIAKEDNQIDLEDARDDNYQEEKYEEYTTSHNQLQLNDEIGTEANDVGIQLKRSESQRGNSSLNSSARIAKKRKSRRLKKELIKNAVKKPEVPPLLAAHEYDEYELLCIRAVSSVPDTSDATLTSNWSYRPSLNEHSIDNSYETDDGYYCMSPAERRELRRKRDRRHSNKVPLDAKPRNTTDKSEMCFKNYKGNCMDVECLRSHEFRYSRNMEICKFYLTKMCSKTNCTYLHSM